jgi:hypothetical protein
LNHYVCETSWAQTIKREIFTEVVVGVSSEKLEVDSVAKAPLVRFIFGQRES